MFLSYYLLFRANLNAESQGLPKFGPVTRAKKLLVRDAAFMRTKNAWLWKRVKANEVYLTCLLPCFNIWSSYNRGICKRTCYRKERTEKLKAYNEYLQDKYTVVRNYYNRDYKK